MKLGIAAGIGFFLALVALENAGIVAADPATLVTLGDLGKPQAWLAVLGFLFIAGLALHKVPGAIILGVLAVTLAAVGFGLEPLARDRRGAAFARAGVSQDGRRGRVSARGDHDDADAPPRHHLRHDRHA